MLKQTPEEILAEVRIIKLLLNQKSYYFSILKSVCYHKISYL